MRFIRRKIRGNAAYIYLYFPGDLIDVIELLAVYGFGGGSVRTVIGGRHFCALTIVRHRCFGGPAIAYRGIIFQEKNISGNWRLQAGYSGRIKCLESIIIRSVFPEIRTVLRHASGIPE